MLKPTDQTEHMRLKIPRTPQEVYRSNSTLMVTLTQSLHLLTRKESHCPGNSCSWIMINICPSVLMAISDNQLAFTAGGERKRRPRPRARTPSRPRVSWPPASSGASMVTGRATGLIEKGSDAPIAASDSGGANCIGQRSHQQHVYRKCQQLQ